MDLLQKNFRRRSSFVFIFVVTQSPVIVRNLIALLLIFFFTLQTWAFP